MGADAANPIKCVLESQSLKWLGCRRHGSRQWRAYDFDSVLSCCSKGYSIPAAIRDHLAFQTDGCGAHGRSMMPKRKQSALVTARLGIFAFECPNAFKTDHSNKFGK